MSKRPRAQLCGGTRLSHELRLTGHKGRTFDAAFSHGGARWVASAGEDHRALLWRPDGSAAGELAGGHDSEAMRVAWHPEQHDRLFTGGTDGYWCVWDAQEQKRLARHRCSEEEVYGLNILTADMALLGASNTVQQWDLNAGVRTRNLELLAAEGSKCFGGASRNPESKVFLFGLASRGRLAGAALSDGTVRLIDTEECRECFARLRQGQSPALSVAFSPTSAELVTTGQDGSVNLWDLRQVGHGARLSLRGGAGAVHCCTFVPQRHGAAAMLMATGCADGTLSLWDTKDGSVACTLKMPNPVLCCAVSAPADDAADDAPLIAVGSGGGRLFTDDAVRVWRVSSERGRVPASPAAVPSPGALASPATAVGLRGGERGTPAGPTSEAPHVSTPPHTKGGGEGRPRSVSPLVPKDAVPTPTAPPTASPSH